MVDINQISNGLEMREDGIWYSSDAERVSYPADGYDNCFAVEDHSFWFRHRNNCILSVISAHPPAGNETIFDIGGGNGYVSAGLSVAGFDVALVEPGAKGCSNARRRGLNKVICGTASTTSFYPGSLPAVGLFDVIEHIEDDLAFLDSMRSLLRTGGYLYATVPSYSFLWSQEDVSTGHFRRYSLDGISDVLIRAGFRIEFSSYFFRLLPLPIFLLRALPYRLGFGRGVSKGNASRDHAVRGGSLARLLDVALKRETDALSNGKTMMFGASCILVARKA